MIGTEASPTAKESPSQSCTLQLGALSNNSTVANGTTSLVQGVAENTQENDGSDDALDGEEVLDLSVGDTQKGKLKEEIKHKTTHSSCGDALISGDVIRDFGKARPNGCEQDGHALATSCSLNTMPSISLLKLVKWSTGKMNLPKPDNGEDTTG